MTTAQISHYLDTLDHPNRTDHEQIPLKSFLTTRINQEFWREFQERTSPSREELTCLINLQERANYSSPLM